MLKALVFFFFFSGVLNRLSVADGCGHSSWFQRDAPFHWQFARLSVAPTISVSGRGSLLSDWLSTAWHSVQTLHISPKKFWRCFNIYTGVCPGLTTFREAGLKQFSHSPHPQTELGAVRMICCILGYVVFRIGQMQWNTRHFPHFPWQTHAAA